MSTTRSQLRHDFEAYIRASAVPSLVMLAYVLWDSPWLFPPLQSPVNLNFNIELAVSSILFPIVMASWFTYCRSGAIPAWLPLNLLTIFKTYAAIILLLAIMFAPAMIFFLAVSAYHGFPAHVTLPPSLDFVLIPVVLWALVAFVSFLPLVPEAASGGRIHVRKAWQRTYGFRWLMALKIVLFFVASILALLLLIVPVEYPAFTRQWYAWPVITWSFLVGWAVDFCMLWGLNRIMMRLTSADGSEDFVLNATADARQR